MGARAHLFFITTDFLIFALLVLFLFCARAHLLPSLLLPGPIIFVLFLFCVCHYYFMLTSAALTLTSDPTSLTDIETYGGENTLATLRYGYGLGFRI